MTKPVKGYVGWALPEADRTSLMTLIPPVYPDVIAHHVTLAFNVTWDYPLPSARSGFVIGVADDGEGVQALVVEIDGSVYRPDGRIFHITWSIDRAAGRKPVDSNAVIATGPLRMIAPIAITLIPTFFEGT